MWNNNNQQTKAMPTAQWWKIIHHCKQQCREYPTSLISFPPFWQQFEHWDKTLRLIDIHNKLHHIWPADGLRITITMPLPSPGFNKMSCYRLCDFAIGTSGFQFEQTFNLHLVWKYSSRETQNWTFIPQLNWGKYNNVLVTTKGKHYWTNDFNNFIWYWSWHHN